MMNLKLQKTTVQENADEISRQQRECSEQIQVEMQKEKEIVEKRTGELRSEWVSNELIQGKGVVNQNLSQKLLL
jgi:hypothetical protein